MFANIAIAFGGPFVRWGQVLAFRQGILGGPPILSGGMGALFSYFYLFLINLSIGVRVRNWSKLVEQC